MRYLPHGAQSHASHTRARLTDSEAAKRKRICGSSKRWTGGSKAEHFQHNSAKFISHENVLLCNDGYFVLLSLYAVVELCTFMDIHQRA